MPFYLQIRLYFYFLIEILKSEATAQDHSEVAKKNDDGMWNIGVFVGCLGVMRCS